jgi:hypothetical protein
VSLLRYCHNRRQLKVLGYHAEKSYTMETHSINNHIMQLPRMHQYASVCVGMHR